MELFPHTPRGRESLMGPSSTCRSSIDGMLDVTLHHARDIHNICIYGNQDVYAKFSITHTQDAVYSTQPIRGGGKNPLFNQNLQILISELNAVLKCEIWMMSCARTYLEDQLLGFVLVPLCDLLGQGRVTKDYSLSSTDLFHTPAGVVCLSLTFYLRGAEDPLHAAASLSRDIQVLDTMHRSMLTTNDLLSNSSHDVESDGHDAATNGDHPLKATDYDTIEFPDLQSACENQHLVSLYLKMASDDMTQTDQHTCSRDNGVSMCVRERGVPGGASFLQLGSLSLMTDCEHGMGVGEEKGEETSHPFEDGHVSPAKDSVLSLNLPVSWPASTISAVAMVKPEEVHTLDSKSTLSVDVTNTFTLESGSSQASPSVTSLMPVRGPSASEVIVSPNSNGQETRSSVVAPGVSISLDQEEQVVQQQIVDMYMKSMQQFTESLAKMKPPAVDLENVQGIRELEGEQPQAETEGQSSGPSTKDGYRIFYGSRAFF